MHVTHEERPARLTTLAIGVAVIGLAAFAVFGIARWESSTPDRPADTGSIVDTDRSAAMDAVDAGPRQLEAWENAYRDIDQQRISQMDAADARQQIQEQTELAFPFGRPVHETRDDILFQENNVDLPQGH